MTPERWQQIKEIFDAALERAPEQRPAFLAEACAGNESLIDEIQTLLAEHNRANEFLKSPAWLKGAIIAPASEFDRATSDGLITPGRRRPCCRAQAPIDFIAEGLRQPAVGAVA